MHSRCRRLGLAVPLAVAMLVASSDRAALAAAKGHPAAKAARPVSEYTIEQFLANTTYLGESFSPDGKKLLVTSNQTGVFNAFALPVDGGPPVRLTDSKVNAVHAEGYFPRDERFLYSSDQGGNERDHIYVQSPDGKVQDLTPGDSLKAQFLDWAADDIGFFFTTNERNPSTMDLYEIAADGYARQKLFECPEGYQVGGISPDRRYVVLGKARSTADSDIYLHDRQSGETKLLTPREAGEGEVSNNPQAFTPDGKALLYTTDRGSQFAYLLRHDLATGKSTPVLRTDWDVAGAGYSHDGRWLLVAINRDARTEVRLFDAATMKRVALPAVAGADITNVAFSRNGRQIAFQAESAAPRNLYVGEIGSGKPRRLTQALNKEIDPAALVDAQVVRFKSYDGTVIPGLLYRPRAASPAHKAPTLVWVHGGPGGQSRVGYSALIQFLVNHGYGVYAINNRGSSGYGKTFFTADDRKHGEADLDDCVASKKMLAATGWVDPGRIGILGGSYGGYMVLAALAYRPREFAAGVDMYGVSNWLRTLESIPAWWGPAREALYKELGDPQKDADYLKRISPLFHADQIERPLLVLQGENDPRVLQVESDEIVAAVRKKGVPVEYVVFPHEGHGFALKESQEKAYRAALDFLDKYLKNAAAGPAGP
jgi:dipeptidyl aminopeptidase/acylaminoacyl peptidase